MTKEEIGEVVADVLARQEITRKRYIESAVKEAVTDLFQSFGIHEDERKELRADFQHLRTWRKAVEQGQSMTMRAAVTVLVSGLIGAVWLGFKAYVGK